MKLVSDFYRERELLRAMVRDLVGDGGRTLDLGCKTGDVSRGFAVAGADVVGLDLERHVEWTEAPAGVRFVNGDGARLPFADDAFDTVVASESLQYMPEPGRVLAEVARVLRPGGRFVVSFPEGGPLTDYLDPDNLSHLAGSLVGRTDRGEGRFVRHLRAARIVAELPSDLRLEEHHRRGSIMFIQLAAAIDLVQELRVRFGAAGDRPSPIGEVLLRPALELLFRAMRLDFRLGLGRLSYNNVLRLEQVGRPAAPVRARRREAVAAGGS